MGQWRAGDNGLSPVPPAYHAFAERRKSASSQRRGQIPRSKYQGRRWPLSPAIPISRWSIRFSSRFPAPSRENHMARTDAIVLGAGIVGVRWRSTLPSAAWPSRWSTAASRGRAPLTATPASSRPTRCFRRAFPEAFPRSCGSRSSRRRKRTTMSGSRRRIAPWLLAFRRYSSPEHLVETTAGDAAAVFRAVTSTRRLAESGAERYMRHTGWLKLYRSDRRLPAGA